MALEGGRPATGGDLPAGHTVLIAFRGTDDPKDWLVNTDAVPQLVPHGVIHRGFYQGMKALYPEVAAAATAQGAEKKNLWITGHSLGGALAVAFAYETLVEGRLKPAGVVTFGQPLVADIPAGRGIPTPAAGASNSGHFLAPPAIGMS